ncbi:MAG: CoB--CoM heterodisulfide reductase iron-sulfur subunit A family protein, partial [Alphaproteobacteria bacterium]|nr:CoB--CoM heterodisulfide reductase iron-sulfur subunit A family protein [Alphaproteobacteria bacterium]
MTDQKPRSQTILVVGGGISGVTTALEAAEAGYEVVILEKSASLGGRVAQLNRYFPKLCHPSCGLEINFQRIRKNPRVKVVTMSTVAGVKGARGDYTVTVSTAPRYVKPNCTACGDCAKASETKVPNPFDYGLGDVGSAYLPHEMAFPMRYVVAPQVIGTPEADKIKAACKYDAIDLGDKETTFDINVGAIVWATGWQPYGAGKISPYRYDYLKDVITNVEMERLAARNGPTEGRIVRPSDGKEPKTVALIQCAGSRDLNHLAYCSRICCLASMKHAAYVREQYADATVDIY